MTNISGTINDSTGRVGDKEFARICNVSTRAIARWRGAGNTLPWTTADVAATAIQMHPRDIWGEDWDVLDQDVVEGTGSKKKMMAVEAAMDQIGAILGEQARKERGARDAGVAIKVLADGSPNPRDVPYFLGCVSTGSDFMVEANNLFLGCVAEWARATAEQEPAKI